MSAHDLVSRSARAWKQSAHHGAGEWLAERFSSLALIPLIAWTVYAAWQMVGGGFDAAMTFVKTPLHMGLIALTVLISAWHMYMGLKVIIEDYIGKPGTRGFLMFLVFLLCAATVLGTAGALYLVYRGA